jgi:hypothetical protein
LDKKINNVLIIGGRAIGLEYASIVSFLGQRATVITRSGCNEDASVHTEVIAGDVAELSLKYLQSFTHFIIAVQPRYTFSILRYLLENTQSHILVEKPVSLSSKDFECLDVDQFNERVYVAFNRRSFESTKLARSIIGDKPIVSMEICFTEMKDRMKGSDDEIRLWGMCNTIHLFDMAFHLAGIPDNVQTLRSTIDDVDSYSVTGNLPNGVVSMNAHWGGPGNWSISVATPDEKLFFDPLEKLRVQKSGSFIKDEIPLDPGVNGGFKDGFLSQTVDFLDGSKDKFIPHANYKRLILVIEKIFS